MAIKIIITNTINIVGRGWYGQEMSYTYNLREYDLENIRNASAGNQITREGVQDWIDKNAGDFQFVDDFEVDIGDPEKDGFYSTFATNKGYELWLDCMGEKWE